MKPDIPSTSTTRKTSSSDEGVAQNTSHASHCNGELRALYSQQLFGAANEVLIEHAGSTYRLRITQANKLILTK